MPSPRRQPRSCRPARLSGAAGLAALLALVLAVAPAPVLADEAGDNGERVIAEVETAVRMYFPAGPPADDPATGDGRDTEAPAPQAPAPQASAGRAASPESGSRAALEGGGSYEGASAETGLGLGADGGNEVSVSWALAPLSPEVGATALAGALMAALAAALAYFAFRQSE